MPDCLFCKIARAEIPAKKVYEDAEILAFHDIHPLRALHLLVIPKRHITSLASVSDADTLILGKMLGLANRLALENGSPDGFRAIINTGRIGGQEVAHLHVHIIGGENPVGAMLSNH